MPQPFAAPRRTLSFALAAAALAAAGGYAAGGPAASDAKDGGQDSGRGGKVDLFAPHNGDRAGQGGKGWFVDLSVSGDSTVYAAVVGDLDHNGIYDDAPDKVADADDDGDVDERDLKAMGLASGVEKADFSIPG